MVIDGEFRAGGEAEATCRVKNAGSRHLSGSGRFPVQIGFRWARLQDGSHSAVEIENVRESRGTLGAVLAPGGELIRRTKVAMPQTPGLYELQCSLVQEGVAWFCDTDPGSGVVVRLEIQAS